MLLPHIDSRTTGDLFAMCDTWPECCIPMMGLHPTSVKENYQEELAWIEKLLQQRKCCAIGEVGIDLYWDKRFKDEQIDAFRRQILWAEQYHLPLVIHTRNSLEEAMEVVRKEISSGTFPTGMAGGMSGVFHCFPGDADQAWRVIEMGFFLGIGGVVTYKNSAMARVVEAIPLDYIVLETDAPFLPPHPKRGQRNEPSLIPFIAQKIAEIKKISPETVAEVTTKNARALFLFEAD